MATTVGAIAAAAIDAVAAQITGVAQTFTLTRTTLGTYDPSTGAHTPTTATDTGRAIFDTVKPINDVFPGYVVGPADKLIFLEGLDTLAPAENDTLTIGGTAYTVKTVQDILGVGQIFYVVAI